MNSGDENRTLLCRQAPHGKPGYPGWNTGSSMQDINLALSANLDQSKYLKQNPGIFPANWGGQMLTAFLQKLWYQSPPFAHHDGFPTSSHHGSGDL
jgi:hypothetical protein